MLEGEDISLQAAGAMSMAFFVAYAIGQLLNGALADRRDPRRMTMLGMGIGCVCNALMSLLNDPSAMIAVWGVNGYALSMVWPAVVRMIAAEPDACRREKNAIRITTSMAIGTLASYGLSSLMLRWFGWRQVFAASAMFALALNAAFVFLSRQDATVAGKARLLRNSGAPPAHIMAMPALRKALPALLVVALLSMMHGVLKEGVTTWAPAYLTVAYDISASASMLSMLLSPLMNLGGAFLAGWLYRRLNRRMLTACALLFGATTLFLILPLLGGRDGVFGVAVAVLVLSAVTTMMMAINTIFLNLLPLCYVEQGIAATISGSLNAIAYAGAGASGLLAGGLLDTGRSGNLMWFWMVLALGGAALCTFTAYLRERRQA